MQIQREYFTWTSCFANPSSLIAEASISFFSAAVRLSSAQDIRTLWILSTTLKTRILWALFATRQRKGYGYDYPIRSSHSASCPIPSPCNKSWHNRTRRVAWEWYSRPILPVALQRFSNTSAMGIVFFKSVVECLVEWVEREMRVKSHYRLKAVWKAWLSQEMCFYRRVDRSIDRSIESGGHALPMLKTWGLSR